MWVFNIPTIIFPLGKAPHLNLQSNGNVETFTNLNFFYKNTKVSHWIAVDSGRCIWETPIDCNSFTCHQILQKLQQILEQIVHQTIASDLDNQLDLCGTIWIY